MDAGMPAKANRLPPLATDARVWSLLAANVAALLVALHQDTAISSLVILIWIQMNFGLAFGIAAVLLFPDLAFPIRLAIAATTALVYFGLQLAFFLSVPGEPKFAALQLSKLRLDYLAVAFAALVFIADGWIALRGSMRHDEPQSPLLAIEPLAHPMYLFVFLLLVGLPLVAKGASGTATLMIFSLLKTVAEIYIHRQILRSREIAKTIKFPSGTPG